MMKSRTFALKSDPNGHPYLQVAVGGITLLRFALLNKGTAFTPEERAALGLEGLLPPVYNDLEQQLERVYQGYVREGSPISKYQFLRSLQERNEILFYALLERHLDEMLPIVYTPTVGDAVMQFSALYQHPRGLSFSEGNVARAAEVVGNYHLDDVRMIVATDSSAILGIGDQGYGGLAIPIGKLALYTVAGGVSPFQTLPVALDVGTDREDLIEDTHYLGARHRRLRDERYLAFIDAFVAAVKERWPKAVIQWEDLSKDAAFAVLERHRRHLPSFNDDIQGTGAVALAGLISASRLKGERLRDQRVVILGAGAGGIGVAWAIREGMVRDGLSREEAAARVFVLDSKGLLTTARAEQMEEYKRS
jgi:malate dehydrogenase (oxaloacetate-decarboxylating)